MDFSPYHDAFDQDGALMYEHLMSGDWAWNQAVSSLKYAMMYRLMMFQNKIAHDPKTQGSMFVPIILGSDKTYSVHWNWSDGLLSCVRSGIFTTTFAILIMVELCSSHSLQ